MSEFRVIAPDLRVSIPIMSKNTIIEGDSGTGKTFMINKLHAIKNSKMLRSDTKSTVDFDDIIIVRNRYETGLVDMKNTKHKLILLDKADTYLDKHWVDFINKSKNTFIIMTRGSDAAKNIMTTQNSCLIVQSETKDGITNIKAKISI